MTSKPKPPSSSANTANSAAPDGLRKAALHYRLAMNYQIIAKRMKDRHTRTGETAYQCLAGEAAYSAAKQGINAIANLDGRDPKGNQQKIAELDRIQHAFPQHRNLRGLSRAALNLHFNADQADLTTTQWQSEYQQTDQLINTLLEIYLSKTNAQHPTW